jgi:hypothetical protein
MEIRVALGALVIVKYRVLSCSVTRTNVAHHVGGKGISAVQGLKTSFAIVAHGENSSPSFNLPDNVRASSHPAVERCEMSVFMTLSRFATKHNKNFTEWNGLPVRPASVRKSAKPILTLTSVFQCVLWRCCGKLWSSWGCKCFCD